MQTLLTARVERLPPRDRALLQAAAVIGRRFDPQLLAAAVDDTGDIEARLAAMQALDLVYPEGVSGEYAFKHALVRDALYQSLLTGARSALHLTIARGDRAPQRQSAIEVVEETRTSLQPNGSRRQSVHLSDYGRGQELRRLQSRRFGRLF